MSRYRFELATPADDPQLRQLLAATPMAGEIALSFRREPSYFAAATVEGTTRQVVVARDLASGSIVGFGSRAISERFVNGQVQAVGYLSSLRLLPQQRNRGLVARGYAYFRELHGDGRAPFYLTTIAAGNDLARRLLTSERAGLPRYEPLGDYLTFAMPLTNGRASAANDGIEVVPAHPEAWPELLAFLGEQGPRRQFFPCYQQSDFAPDGQTLRGLGIENIWLAYRRGLLVGTLAAWDQSAFKQTVVHGYSRRLAVTRPVYNAWAQVTRRPTLPAPGKMLKYLTLALPVVRDDDPAVLAALVRTVAGQHRNADFQHLLLGLHEHDPLCAAVHGFPHTVYRTHVYRVYWPAAVAAIPALDERTVYLELGCL